MMCLLMWAYTESRLIRPRLWRRGTSGQLPFTYGMTVRPFVHARASARQNQRAVKVEQGAEVSDRHCSHMSQTFIPC